MLPPGMREPQVYAEYLRRRRRRRCCGFCLILVVSAVGLQAYRIQKTLAQFHPAGSHPRLRMEPGGSFRLALFCDMHFGEFEARDRKSTQFQKALLQLESPDLVVIDGDASSNYASPLCPLKLGCQNFFREQWLKFTATLRESGTPYAYTLGNHDRIPRGLGLEDSWERDYAVTDHWIMNLDKTFSSMSVSQDGPAVIHGASNYVVPILGAEDLPVFYLWLLDSMDTNCLGIHGWGCVYPDQVEWYRRTSARLIEQDGRVVPGLMFHHIPLPEVLEAWNDGSASVNGSLDEPVCCFSSNTGLFDAIKEVGNVKGVFHGHDHNNDFIASYRGIFIGYGRKSGYGGYGGRVADKPGSRIFQLRLDDIGQVSWETWIRLETGERLIQDPVPAEQRLSQPQRQCCGMRAAVPVNVNASFDYDLGSAIQACRVHDDAHMCRIATGLSPPGVRTPF